jgi:hypothetical protein
MITHTMKILSAAVIAAALIGTVAVSRTVHSGADAPGAPPAHDSAMNAAPGAATRPALNGFIACGALSTSDCENLGTWLPE